MWEAVASGISPEETESDIALADIIERFKQTDEKKSKNEADTLKVAEMRRRSLETFSESNARLGNEPMVKNSRNTGTEAVQYSREKVRMNRNNSSKSRLDF